MAARGFATVSKQTLKCIEIIKCFTPNMIYDLTALFSRGFVSLGVWRDVKLLRLWKIEITFITWVFCLYFLKRSLPTPRWMSLTASLSLQVTSLPPKPQFIFSSRNYILQRSLTEDRRCSEQWISRRNLHTSSCLMRIFDVRIFPISSNVKVWMESKFDK